MPERMFSPAWGVLFAVLFFIGLYAFFRKGDEKDRAIGYFSAGIFAVWTLASILPKVTVSPTRHSLIFTPLIVITVSRGIYFAIEKLKISKGKEILPLFLSAALLLTSLMSFDQFLKSRRDPFVEEEIRTVLQEHPVDVMFRVNFTSQVSLMKSVRELTGIYDENTDIYAMVPRQPASFDRIAWISHRDKLTADSFEQLRLKANLIVRYMNQQRLRQGLQPIPMMDGSLKDYQIIYRKEIASDQEIEYSRATQNGSNNLFFYILNRKISNL